MYSNVTKTYHSYKFIICRRDPLYHGGRPTERQIKVQVAIIIAIVIAISIVIVIVVIVMIAAAAALYHGGRA